MLQRLSIGPTVPEQLDAELVAWASEQAAPLRRKLQVDTRFRVAELLLFGAATLLRLRLIEPPVAGWAFDRASRLIQDGMRKW